VFENGNVTLFSAVLYFLWGPYNECHLHVKYICPVMYMGATSWLKPANA